MSQVVVTLSFRDFKGVHPRAMVPPYIEPIVKQKLREKGLDTDGPIDTWNDDATMEIRYRGRALNVSGS